MRMPALLLALAALSLSAAGERPLPAELPAYGRDPVMPVPAVRQRRLPNGLTVWMVPREGLPRVGAILVARGGTASDPAGRLGLGGTLAGLLKEGTRRRNGRQLAEDLQAIGGDLDGWAEADGTFLQGAALSSGAPALIALLGECATEPGFPEAEVTRARSRILAGIQDRESDPGFQARSAFLEAIYGGHPYRCAGPGADWIRTLDRAQLLEAHASRFRPGECLLVVVGRFSAREVDRAVDQAFGKWRDRAAASPPPPQAPSAAAPRFVIKDRKGAVQTTFCIGRQIPSGTHDDFLALRLAGEMAGGSFGSRITRNIREDKGYTYSPWMTFQDRVMGGDLCEAASVRTDVTGETLLEVFYELDRLGISGVGADELDRAKRKLGGRVLFDTLSLGGYGKALASGWIRGQTPADLPRRVARIQALTAGEVRSAARRYLNPRTLTVVAVGNEAAITTALAPWTGERASCCTASGQAPSSASR